MAGNEQLEQAFNVLTIVEIAHKLGYMQMKEGAGQRSPFRDDKKAGSFSVMKTGFRDHAHEEHSGGHWKFVALARPDWESSDIANFLIEASGQVPKKWTPGKMKAAEKEQRGELYRKAAREKEKLPKLELNPPEWSAAVRKFWNEGAEALLKEPKEIARRRGWSVDLVRHLIETGKMARPYLPWATKRRKERGYAFVVEKPVLSGGKLSHVIVGYHQRFIVFNQASQKREKQWVFVPYIPALEKVHNSYQRQLRKEGNRIPALPWFAGSVARPKLVVTIEGQWDAASFAEAFGWYDNGFPEGVCVLGLRGVQSYQVTLAAYGPWLKTNRPTVWYIGDNDTAGKSVARRKNATKISGEPSFLDRLRAIGCPVVAQALVVEGCNDFNDVYKAHSPDREAMQKWADSVGVGGMTK